MTELTTSLVLQEQNFYDKTYKLSAEKIEGFADGLESLKQAIYKVLATEQYEYPIYSFDYGIAWKELIGEMKRMIQEVLLLDDRILEVDGFNFEFKEDICRCTFNVSSIYGDVEIEKRVSV